MPHQTLNDYLSFVIHPLQLKAFSHIMSNMITKLVIYGVINLRILLVFVVTILHH